MVDTKQLNASLGAVATAARGLTSPLGALTAGIGIAVGAVKQVSEFAQKNIAVNERLLLLGTNQVSMFMANREALLENTASINDQLSVAAEMRDLGIDQFRKESVNLAANMKMTGQNTGAALKLFEGLEKNTELTVFAQEELAKDIQKTSDMFGRTAESIVKALEQVNRTYLERTGQNVMEMSKLAMEVGGKFGQDAAELLGNTLKSLEISSPEDIAKLTSMGIADEVQAFMANPNLNTAREMADAIKPFRDSINLMAPEMRQFGIATRGNVQIFDNLRLLSDELSQPERAVGEQNGLQQTLAATRARAQKQAEVNVATIDGFRDLVVLGTKTNAILQRMSTFTIGGLVGSFKDFMVGSDEKHHQNVMLTEERNRIAREQSDMNKQERLAKQTAATFDTASLARFAVEGNKTLIAALMEQIGVQRQMAAGVDGMAVQARAQAMESKFKTGADS